MQLTQKDLDFIATYSARDYPRPSLTADTALFRIHQSRINSEDKAFLEVLLIRRGNPPYEGGWALPGGFCGIDEDIQTCAKRELYEETGLKGYYFGQIATYSKVGRDPRTRVITVNHLAMLAYDESNQPVAGDDAKDARWFRLSFAVEELSVYSKIMHITLINEAVVLEGVIKLFFDQDGWHKEIIKDCDLAFDHLEMICDAIVSLRKNIFNTNLAFVGLPQHFLLKDLQAVYEVILNKSFERTDFLKCIKHQVQRIAIFDGNKHIIEDMFKSVDYISDDFGL